MRNVAGDIVENVELVSEFKKEDGRHSQHYRITYRDMSRTLLNEEVNALQETVRQRLQDKLNVILR